MSDPVAGAPAAVRRGPDRKSQLARIAADLFCERGYYAVGLGEIATEAGITGPAVYKHFRNKQAILAHAAREITGALEELVARSGERTGPAAARLDALVRDCAGLVIERRRSVRLYQWERRHLEPADHARFTAALRHLVGAVAGLLGETRPELSGTDRTTLASAVLSGLASLGTHRTPLSAKAAEAGLRGVASRVLAADLPPRGAVVPEPDSAGPGEFVSRRERLLVAAPRTFRERGFHGVTMEDLGAAAGISGSSVYRHFAGKADLLAAVYYRAADRLTAAMGVAIERARSPEEALRAVIDAYVGYAFRHADLAAVYLSEYGNLPAGDRHALRKVQREHVEQWVRLVAATRQGTRGARVRLAVHAALNIAHDLSMNRARPADPDQVRHLVSVTLAT
nr:TetR/AcrR family transcriptional regulator [Prauserella shujinwangii]